MNKKTIKHFINLINEKYKCFNMEAPITESLPYLVLSNVNNLKDDNPYITFALDFDIYIDSNSNILENDVIDNLIKYFDSTFINEQNISYKIEYNNSNINNNKEQEFEKSQISFYLHSYR